MYYKGKGEIVIKMEIQRTHLLVSNPLQTGIINIF